MLRKLIATNSDVAKCLIISALIGFVYSGIIVVVFNLYLLRLGYDTRFIGIANGCMPIAFALSGIVAGILGSRWGSRKTITTALVLLVLGVCLIPLTENLDPKNRDIAIIFLRILSGTGFSFFLVNIYPYLVAATTAKERVFIFSLQAATGPAAGFSGAAIAGFLPSIIAKTMEVDISSPLPFALMLVFSGLILIPAIPVVLTTRERLKATGKPSYKRNTATIKPITLIIFFLCISAFLRTAGESTTQSFFNVYLELILNETPRRIGLIMATGQLIALPAALFAPIIANHTGKINGVVLSTFLTGAGLILTTLTQHWTIAALGYALTISARIVVQTLAAVVQMEIVPTEFRGITSGSIALTGGIGFGSMSLLGGYLIPLINFRGLYLFGGALAWSASAIFWLYFHHPRGNYQQREQS